MADLSQQLSSITMNTPTSASFPKSPLPTTLNASANPTTGTTSSTRRFLIRAGRDHPQRISKNIVPKHNHRSYTSTTGAPLRSRPTPAARRLHTPAITTPPGAGNPATVSNLARVHMDFLRRQHQIRLASSARRHKKQLNIAPAPDPEPPADLTGMAMNAEFEMPVQPESPMLPSMVAGTTGRSRLGRKVETQTIDENSLETQMQGLNVSGGEQQSEVQNKTMPTSMPLGGHIVFNPPPSVPNPYHTPDLFLPNMDTRKTFQPPALSPTTKAGIAATATETNKQPLPPPLIRRNHNSASHTKHYNLPPSAITAMRELRASDPNKWGREQLAREFGCSPLFAGMCSAGLVSKTKIRKTQGGRQGVGRRIRRGERKARREAWGVQE